MRGASLLVSLRHQDGKRLAGADELTAFEKDFLSGSSRPGTRELPQPSTTPGQILLRSLSDGRDRICTLKRCFISYVYFDVAYFGTA